jgi:hypothetical protein
MSFVPRRLLSQFCSPHPRRIAFAHTSLNRPHLQFRAAFPQRIRTMATSIPTTMKGVVMEKYGGVDVLEYRTDLPVPTPKDGEILVKNEYTGVNFIDTYLSPSPPHTVSILTKRPDTSARVYTKSPPSPTPRVANPPAQSRPWAPTRPPASPSATQSPASRTRPTPSTPSCRGTTRSSGRRG